MGQTSVPTDILSNHHSDRSATIIPAPHSPTDSLHSAIVDAQRPVHGETAYGYLSDLIDPLIIIQQCLEDKLPLVWRRLTHVERKAIKSGSIFAFIESNVKKKASDGRSSPMNKNSKTMKRWTDGLAWSKSRVHGHFLVYKEVKQKGCISKKIMHDGTEFSAVLKPDGLVKKTFSIVVDDHTWHVINYYFEDDVLNGLLSSPRVNFPSVRIYDKLLDQSKFKLQSSGPCIVSPGFVSVRGRGKEVDQLNRLTDDFGVAGHLNDCEN